MEEHSMIHEALQRTMDTVLMSRIPYLKHTKDHLSLLLVAPTVDSVRDGLRDQWRKNGNTTYRVDVIYSSNLTVQKPVLLERWEITHQKEPDLGVDDINAQLMRAYKRITVMLRTLHSFCRIVPAYQVFNQARSKHEDSGMKVDFSISVQHNPSTQWDAIMRSNHHFSDYNFDPQLQIKNFTFPEIITPHGELTVGVHYRNDVSFLKEFESTGDDFTQVSKPKSGLGALLSQPTEIRFDNQQTNNIPFPTSPYYSSSLPKASTQLPPRPPSLKNVLSSPKSAGKPYTSRPVTIPNGNTRPRSRSDHVYSKSEGYRPTEVLQHSFQWPNQQETAERDYSRKEENSFSGAPFLLVESASLNSDSPTPVRCSPPLGFMSQPNSLLSSSPQTMLDQRPYSAASMIKHGDVSDHEEEAFHSLPESPFTRSQLDPFYPGPDSLPNEIPSIFSSMHGLSLGPSNLGTAQPSPSEVQQDSDTSFLDLPFACNLDLEEDSHHASAFSDDQLNGDYEKNNSFGSKSLQVSSFVHFIDSAPQLSLFSPATGGSSSSSSTTATSGINDAGGSGGIQSVGTTIDDELRECQLFGQALRS